MIKAVAMAACASTALAATSAWSETATEKFFKSIPAGKIHDPDKNAFREVFEMCVEPPATTDDARAALIAGGWTIDDQALGVATLNASIISNFDSRDLDKTLENAFFTATHWLGNSALGRDQVGARQGEFYVAFLGISEGTSHCVITGPAPLNKLFFGQRDAREIMSQAGPALVQNLGFFQERLASSGWFFPGELEKMISSLDQSSEALEEIRGLIKAETIHIQPAEVFQ
ncbi:MAG: hypothetical protein ABJL99_25410 [Aliishimia sp.]